MLRSLLRLVLVIPVAAIGLAAVIAAALPQVGSIITAHDSTASLPPLNPLAERSIVYDAYGNPIAAFAAEENRSPVKIAEVPTGVIDAVLATEDADFYKHHGVNGRSLARATLANVSAGDVVQGGSTITQQVVKLGLVGSKRDANRKLREAMYAVRLERTLTKDQILERYLNTVYFGNSAYGIKAAAETYFGKPVTDLTMAEGASLAGLIRNPAGYDPFRYPDRFRARRKFVLDRLVELDKMTPLDAAAADAVPPPLRRQTTAEAQKPNTYYVEDVKKQLLSKDWIGDDDQQRYNALFRGGLRIHTTFDPFVQQFAEAARNEKLPNTDGRFDAALAAVEPSSGAVKALVGGPGFDKAKYNLASQGRRQPGSSFKTIVLTAAVEAGVQPKDVIDGTSPCQFPNKGGTPDPYEVTGSSGGVGTVDTMIARSINCAFVRLALAVGVDHVIDTATRMLGVPASRFRATPSIGLGVNELTPLEMASAYATLANGGVRHDPFYVTRIEDATGKVIYAHNDEGTRVISPETAASVTSMLTGVVKKGGTGTRAVLDDGRPIAGKTGTTQNNSDAWFVGFTPEIAAAVWMGSPEGQIPMKNIEGFSTVTGGSFPAMIWKAFMDKALWQKPVTPLPDAPALARKAPARLYLPGVECWGRASTVAAQPPTTDATGSTVPTTAAPAGGGSVRLTQQAPPTTKPPKGVPATTTTTILASRPVPSVPVSGYAVGKCGSTRSVAPASTTTTLPGTPPPSTVATTPAPTTVPQD